jgi:leucyl/phenylalanyl-tRNA--protein transferase
MLAEAYSVGVFPWPMPEEEFAWFCPDPRWVIPLENWKPDRSFRRGVRAAEKKFELRWNQNLDAVLQHCAREAEDAVWLTPALRSGLLSLEPLLPIWSAEVYEGTRLVGGAYAVVTGANVSAESMFHIEPDASKLALAGIAERARAAGYPWIDVQAPTPHLERWGAVPLKRDDFLQTILRSFT